MTCSVDSVCVCYICRSVNCPQHLEEQRSELRSILLGKCVVLTLAHSNSQVFHTVRLAVHYVVIADRRKSIELHTPPPAKKSRR